MKGVVTLTTDFGERDGYVGQMKGIILGINPDACIVDITHEITPYSIMEGALALRGVVKCFSFPSYHVAVVDPGVGGVRRPVAVRTGSSYLIGPDNGIFSLLLNELAEYEARSIENSAFMAPAISRTFHGRDIFAPAAAKLSLGYDFRDVGPLVTDLTGLVEPEKIKSSDGIWGEIIHVDRFGNLISNIERSEVEGVTLEVSCGPINVDRLSSCYSDSTPLSPIALTNSYDLLEIALPNDNASRKYGINTGAKVNVRLKKSHPA